MPPRALINLSSDRNGYVNHGKPKGGRSVIKTKMDVDMPSPPGFNPWDFTVLDEDPPPTGAASSASPETPSELAHLQAVLDDEEEYTHHPSSTVPVSTAPGVASAGVAFAGVASAGGASYAPISQPSDYLEYAEGGVNFTRLSRLFPDTDLVHNGLDSPDGSMDSLFPAESEKLETDSAKSRSKKMRQDDTVDRAMIPQRKLNPMRGGTLTLTQTPPAVVGKSSTTGEDPTLEDWSAKIDKYGIAAVSSADNDLLTPLEETPEADLDIPNPTFDAVDIITRQLDEIRGVESTRLKTLITNFSFFGSNDTKMTQFTEITIPSDMVTTRDQEFDVYSRIAHEIRHRLDVLVRICTLAASAPNPTSIQKLAPTIQNAFQLYTGHNTPAHRKVIRLAKYLFMLPVNRFRRRVSKLNADDVIIFSFIGGIVFRALLKDEKNYNTLRKAMIMSYPSNAYTRHRIPDAELVDTWVVGKIHHRIITAGKFDCTISLKVADFTKAKFQKYETNITKVIDVLRNLGDQYYKGD